MSSCNCKCDSKPHWAHVAWKHRSSYGHQERCGDLLASPAADAAYPKAGLLGGSPGTNASNVQQAWPVGEFKKKNKELQISDNVFSSPLVLKTQTSILGDVLFWSPSGFVLKVTKKTRWEFVLDISQHITIYQLTIFNQRRWQQRKESSALHLGRASVMWMLSLLILLS